MPFQTMQEIADSEPDVLALGARSHSIIAGACFESVAARLAQDDWICCACSTRIPECMEVDHAEEHEACGPERLRTICQFCHQLRHPIWAALRGRIRLFWGPGFCQADINRLAWQVFFASPDGKGAIADEALADAAARTVDDVDRRERVLEQIVGSSHPEAFFEALFTSRDLLSESDFLSVSALLDSFIRFWPTAADRASALRASDGSGLKCWRKGRFADVSAEAISSYWSEEANADRLRELRATDFGELQDD